MSSPAAVSVVMFVQSRKYAVLLLLLTQKEGAGGKEMGYYLKTTKADPYQCQNNVKEPQLSSYRCIQYSK